MENDPLNDSLNYNSHTPQTFSDQKPVKSMSSRVAALVILVVGIFALGGGYAIYYQHQIPKSYTITNGIITSSALGINNTTYNIGIKFTANDQKEYSFTSTVAKESALHSSQYFIGNNTVRVAYNPNNPGQHPKNASDKATPIYAVLIMLVGGLFTLLGLISTIQQLIFRK